MNLTQLNTDICAELHDHLLNGMARAMCHASRNTVVHDVPSLNEWGINTTLPILLHAIAPATHPCGVT